jgi:undecaprenyl-diphosphatase
VVAAGVFTIPDIAKGGITPTQMIVATVIAFVVGLAMIAWLLRWVAKHTVYAFVWYRIALGALLFVALGVGWVSAT